MQKVIDVRENVIYSERAAGQQQNTQHYDNYNNPTIRQQCNSYRYCRTTLCNRPHKKRHKANHGWSHLQKRRANEPLSLKPTSKRSLHQNYPPPESWLS